MTKTYCHKVLDTRSQNQCCQQSPTPSEAQRGILPCFCQLLEAPGVLGLCSITLISSSVSPWPSSLGVSMSNIPSSQKVTSHMGLWTHPTQYDLMLPSLMRSAMTLFPNKVVFWGLGPQHVFLKEHNSTHNTRYKCLQQDLQANDIIISWESM